MRVKHTLEITAICPVDQKPDVYECVIEARRVIPVEDILKAAEVVKAIAAFQEDICQELHRQLACCVRLSGYHSGVRTEVVCGDA
jgi:hypothetical protein